MQGEGAKEGGAAVAVVCVCVTCVKATMAAALGHSPNCLDGAGLLSCSKLYRTPQHPQAQLFAR